MDINEFHTEITERLPVIRQTGDFRHDLRKALEEYAECVRQLDPACFPDEKTKTTVLEKIERFTGKIVAVVDLYYDGRRADALCMFREQMDCPDELWNSIGIHTVKEKSGDAPAYWFRARIFDDKREHTFREMFHIPLNRREIVKTQRYSAPGYPCLYLGNTVYSCWEEMHRPHFDDLMFSGFRVRTGFDLYDLRIPKREEFDTAHLEKTTVRLPLIIACMMKVKDTDAPFKPEYIVPQLLIETIICKNRERWVRNMGPCEMTWGVIYTSTHISSDFPFGADLLENIALPVIESDGKMDYCQILASLFDISDPFCYEYEALKENDIKLYWENIGEDLRPADKIQEQYKQSKMGYLESRIEKLGRFQVLPHLVIDIPKEGIVIPQDGSPVPVKIRANGPWKIIDPETIKDPGELPDRFVLE